MAGAELLDQVSVVTDHCSGILRIRVRRDRVILGIRVVKPIDD